MYKKDCVDIIVSICNEVDKLEVCLESVLKYTDLQKNRLLLISSGKLDKEVQFYLDTLNNSNIIYICNENLLRPVDMKNEGILYSKDNDVLLLDLNTVVTPNWLEKIVSCAYSAEEIATVSPLTNGASLYSVPHSSQDNAIPNGMSVDEYALEIERISLKEFPSMPIADDFCMFIKRSVIQEIGLFDAENFGEGFYDTNDFCNRASKIGYKHVMCDTTFVYYKDIKRSMDENDMQKLKEYEIKMEEKHALLNKKLEWHFAYGQNGPINKNIELYYNLNLNNSKRNIFYLVQADFREGASNNIGGTQLHVKDLMLGLREEYNIFVGARDGEYLRVTAYVDGKEVSFLFYIGPIEPYYVYRNSKMFELYENLLLAFKIDLLHVHHTMGLTHEVFYVAHKHDIPIYLTMHDYYYICPTLRLIDEENNSCIGKIDWKKCRTCMKFTTQLYEDVDYIPKWRREHANVLALCEKIITPSQSAADIILMYYPEIKSKLEIISHGIDTTLFNKDENKQPYNHKELRIAFVGEISITKGSEVIYQLITNNQNRFKWYAMGGIDGPLNDLKQSNFKKTGWYKRDELKNLLLEHEIDIVCNLSKVAETYCYTLSEVIACGVPVIVTDIGALGERMKKMQCGWIVSERVTLEELQELLDRIQNNKGEYMEKYSTTQKYSICTIEEMVSEYMQLYSSLKKLDYKGKKFNSAKIMDGHLGSVSIGSLNEIEARNRYLENELQAIYNSNIFKIMKKIAKIIDWVKNK